MFSFIDRTLAALANRRRESTARSARSSRRNRRFEQLEARQMMTGVPAFSSLPGAEITIYLDFDGHHEAEWGHIYRPEDGPIWHDVNTPIFSRDANTDFSATELQLIENIWKCVAEDYAPFNINVTTVLPSEFGLGAATRVAIGGSTMDWYMDPTAGGVAQIDSYRTSDRDTGYVFANDFYDGTQLARQLGDAATHEAAHAFGLTHQHYFDANGAEIGEYNPGNADLAPLMGNSYLAQRSVWWNGAVTQYSTKNDIKSLIEKHNGIELRTDDFGGTLATATHFNVGDGEIHGLISISQSMILHEVSVDEDVDVFIVTVPANGLLKHWEIVAGVDSYAANLDLKLEIYKMQGGSPILVTTIDPNNSLGASFKFTDSGEYLIKVRSHGGFGDIGQYTLDVFEKMDTLPTAERMTRPPLIDIVCDPLQPFENPAIIVSRRVNKFSPVIVTPAKLVTNATTNVVQTNANLAVENASSMIAKATKTAKSLALDAVFADLGATEKWAL